MSAAFANGKEKKGQRKKRVATTVSCSIGEIPTKCRNALVCEELWEL